MRLVSYRKSGSAPGWRAGVAVDGGVIDAASLVPEDDAAGSVRSILTSGSRLLARLAEAAQDAPVIGDVVLGPPVPDPEKILCLGLNYHAHAQESAMEIPPAPILFAKFRNALIGPGVPIPLPAASSKVDYEGELAVVIGRRCKHVDAAHALSCVAGYMILNDISARDLQLQTPQWTAGKAVDGFAPCGPALVTADEVEDPQSLVLTTRLNGEVMQQADTGQMIFSVAETIEFISRLMTLEVGDIVATGTPEGVGAARTPPVFLTAGDEVEVEISGLGVLRNPVGREAPGTVMDAGARPG
jgi:2,4-didehydro-3-deoxy-L-rhamnonate hydrolase